MMRTPPKERTPPWRLGGSRRFVCCGYMRRQVRARAPSFLACAQAAPLLFCTCDERTTTGARAGFARSSLHARRTCRRSLAAHGNTIFYSIRTQYLYWETTTTNKYHAQPCTCTERTAAMHSYVYARSTCGQVFCALGISILIR